MFLSMLPIERRLAFKYLMRFLYQLSQEQEVNKMTPINIALIFGPNVLRPRGESVVTQMNDTPYTNKFFEICLLHFPIVFEVRDSSFSSLNTCALLLIILRND
jgi:hypothetical protein